MKIKIIVIKQKKIKKRKNILKKIYRHKKWKEVKNMILRKSIIMKNYENLIFFLIN